MPKAKENSADVSKLLPGESGYVGRGHPPKHSQIKKGEVRNRWGRNGKPEAGKVTNDFAVHMAKLLSQPMVAKDGQSYEQADVIFNALLKQASAGNLKAIQLYIDLRDKYVVPALLEQAEENLEEGDEAVLARFAEQVLAAADGPRQVTATEQTTPADGADDV